MHIVRELVDELGGELTEHRRSAIAVAAAVLALILALGVASLLGSYVAVAIIAVLDVPGVDVVRARGSGDDTVVELARTEPDCVVVTADRGLRARLPASATAGGSGVPGPSVLGPSALLTRLVVAHEINDRTDQR